MFKYGVEHELEDVLRGFMAALDAAVQEEEDISITMPDEEWEAIRPSKAQRSEFLLKFIKVSANTIH